MTFGSSKLSVPSKMGGHCTAFALAMKYAVKNEANSMISEPMKIVIPRVPMFIRDSGEAL
jgi:hypothetical protein